MERGPSAGDELNLIEKGKNYGWPLVGEWPNYNGVPIPNYDTRPTWRRPCSFGRTGDRAGQSDVLSRHVLSPTSTEIKTIDYLADSFETRSIASRRSSLRSQYRQALIILMIIVGVVLLIACANVANLLLARGATEGDCHPDGSWFRTRSADPPVAYRKYSVISLRRSSGRVVQGGAHAC